MKRIPWLNKQTNGRNIKTNQLKIIQTFNKFPLKKQILIFHMIEMELGRLKFLNFSAFLKCIKMKKKVSEKLKIS